MSRVALAHSWITLRRPVALGFCYHGRFKALLAFQKVQNTGEEVWSVGVALPLKEENRDRDQGVKALGHRREKQVG